MSKFPQNIKKLRLAKRWTQAELAEKVGITATGISYWENGKTEPLKSTMLKLCKIFDVSFEALTGDDINDNIKLDVLGSITNKIPIEEINDIVDTVVIPKNWLKKDDFIALKINDNSMAPRYQQGDNVIIKKQHEVNDGQNALVIIKGHDNAILRRMRKTKHGYILQTLNSDHAPIMARINECDIIGVPFELRTRENL